MQFVRKAAVFVASSAFFLLLLATASATSFKLTFTPQNLKTWVKQSGAYDRFVDEVLKQSAKAVKPEEGGEVPLKRPEIQNAAKQAFSPQFLQTTSEQFIDSTYRWLEGKTPKPDFRLDFAKPKENFANNIGAYLRQRVAGLPPCAKNQMPKEFDPFTVNCRPPGVNTDAEIQRLAQQITASKDFLAEPQVTAETVRTESKQGGQKPFYEHFSYLPKLYPWLQRAPLIFGALALAAAATIIFGSSQRRQGLKRVGTSLLTAGLLLVIGTLFVNFIFSRINQKISSVEPNQPALLQDSALSIVQQMNKSVASPNLIFGIVFACLGAATLIALYFTRQKQAKAPPAAPANHPTPAH